MRKHAAKVLPIVALRQITHTTATRGAEYPQINAPAVGTAPAQEQARR